MKSILIAIAILITTYIIMAFIISFINLEWCFSLYKWSGLSRGILCVWSLVTILSISKK